MPLVQRGWCTSHRPLTTRTLLLCGAHVRRDSQMSAVWGFFDVLPRGRDEKSNMDWLKHKEMYDAE